MKGRIFDIQRFSVHDGPGIRTTVFFKGCPLRCVWCHNPEGISPQPHISFMAEKCAGCGQCVDACHKQAHVLKTANGNTIHTLDRERCDVCGECALVCDSDCLEVVGRAMSVAEVMREVLADRVFYNQTKGGITLSGGEPLLQFEFAEALLQAARSEKIHRCVETSAFICWDTLSRVVPLTDLFLIDWKATNPQEHERLTGQSNELILQNIQKLAAQGADIRLQCPLIPELNDTEEHFAGILSLAESIPTLEGVSLLPYHPLGMSKLARFGWAQRADIPQTSDIRQTACLWAQRLRDHDIPVVTQDAKKDQTAVEPIPVKS